MRLVSLEIKYGDRTLFSNLNLEMEKGLLWIVGPSGSGKSTLLSLIEGSRQPTKGKNVLEEEEQNVCYCGTESTLFPEESFLTNARLLLGLRKLTQKQKDLVDAFSFSPWLDKKILSLSGGERKKAELLLLFFRKPKLYLLDECLSSLDEKTRKVVLSLLAELSEENLVIVVEHEKGISLPYDRKIVFDSKGQVTVLENSKSRKDTRRRDSKTPSTKRSLHPMLWFARNVFRARAGNFLTLFVLSFLSFLCLSLSLCFFQFRPEEEISNTILSADPFSCVRAIPNGEKEVGNDIPDSFLWSLSLSTSNGKTTFVACLSKDDELWHYSTLGFPFTEGESFSVSGKEYLVRLVKKEELSLLPDTYSLSLIRDGYVPGNLTLCSPSFLKGILLSKGTVQSNRGTKLFPELVVSYSQDELLTNRGEEPTILPDRENYFALPGLSQAQEMHYGDFFYPVVPSESGEAEMSLDIYVDLLSRKEQDGLSFFAPKEYFFKEEGRLFSPELFVSDYSERLSTTAIVLLVLGLALLFFTIFALHVFKAYLRSWSKSVKDVYVHSGLAKKILPGEILLSLLLILPGLVAGLLLSCTLFPQLANLFSMLLRYRYAEIPEGFYYYSKEPLCPYYDSLREPLRLFKPSPIILVLVPLALILVFVSTMSLCRLSKNEGPGKIR